MVDIFAHPERESKPAGFRNEAPRLWVRILGIVLGFVGLALLFALFTYDWRDVSVQCAPPQSPPRNVVGYVGAWFGYSSFLMVGGAAWCVPLWVMFSGVWLAMGRKLGWRILGMFLTLLAVMGLMAQAGLAWPSLSEHFGPNAINNGGYSGGVLGHYWVKATVPSIGGGATLSILLALLLLGGLMVVGLRDLIQKAFAKKEETPKKTISIPVAESTPGPEKERDPEKPLTKEELRAQKAAEREAERQRKAKEREEEKQRKAQEREEERQRKAKEREEEKQRKAEERAAAKEAQIFAKKQAAEEKEAAKRAEEEAKKEALANRTKEFLERQRAAAEAAKPKSKKVEPELDDEGGGDDNEDPLGATSFGDEDPEDPEGGEGGPLGGSESEPAGEGGDLVATVEGGVTYVDYTLPTIEYLNPPSEKVEDTGEYGERCSKIIVDTLLEFDILVEVVGIHRGPTITQFELLPAPGLLISKIARVSDNLQAALEAKQLRIVAPIPGKKVIGIEVPNAVAENVDIREVAEGEVWRKQVAKSALPLLIGKDIGGADFTSDLAKMPHLLVAGATGAGKSACINSLLVGLLMTRTPYELRLIMVDPKCVEFTPYAEIPHLLVPVITEWKKVGVALQWAIGEMNRRLKMFAQCGVRNIADYNANPLQVELFPNPLAGPDGRLPYIVIVIDELADLMLMAKTEIEGRIANITAKARAAGIHMIIATQRPSVNVVTGVIKANIPGRIAFKVASPVDSQTILNTKGAEDLLGRGDMLVDDPRMIGCTRVQGCWVSDAEVSAITNDLRDQGKPQYISSLKNKLDEIKGGDGDGEDPPIDPEGDGDEPSGGSGGGHRGAEPSPADNEEERELIHKVLEIFAQTHRASTSSIQRRLGLGYNRAARFLDRLEELGYIGPATSNNAPREILVDLDEVLRNWDSLPEGMGADFDEDE